MKILAIDPGPIQSAWVVWDGEKIYDFNLSPNDQVSRKILDLTANGLSQVVIEKVACYGMPVGESIFTTCFWTGRFYEKAKAENGRVLINLLQRKDVKMYLCHTMRAKDSNIIQALVDRFATHVRNKGKGTKKEPGFFYGFKKDIWQAFALAVAFYDLMEIKGE